MGQEVSLHYENYQSALSIISKKTNTSQNVYFGADQAKPMRQYLFHFLILFLITAFPLHGKCQEFPYDKWISDLSVKKDPRNERYWSVFYEIFKIDSTKHCEIVATLKSKASLNNPRQKIRLLNLEAMLLLYARESQMNLSDCPSNPPPEELLHQALNSAYELEDDILIFQLYNDLVSLNVVDLKFGEATMYGLLAKELYDKYGYEKIYPMATVLHNLAFSLYRSREYRSAIDMSLLYLIRDRGYLSKHDTIPKLNDVYAWNTLGLAYTKLGIVDSAFIAFDNGLKGAKELSNPFWTAIITGNKGDVFFQMGKIDSARTLLKFDYKGSIAAEEFDNAANSLQWLARIDMIHNKPQEALIKTREAHRLLLSAYKPEYMANTLFTYTKVFASLGNADSVSYYLDKFLPLHDSIEKEAADSRTENVLMRLESKENIHTIKTLNKEKKRIALIRNFILILILLFALVGFLILNRQKLKLKVRRQEALEEKRMAEQEARLAIDQLNLFTRSLREKTTMIESLQAQLMDRELTEEQKEHIAALSRHSILTDGDWENFKTLFEKVYPAFFYRLKQKVADLTTADQRMAAMAKLQMSNKEAATLLGIASNSVVKAKQRLRHRLGLEPEADLEQYFSQSTDFN